MRVVYYVYFLFEATILRMQQKYHLHKYAAHRMCVFHFVFFSQFHKGSLQNLSV